MSSSPSSGSRQSAVIAAKCRKCGARLGPTDDWCSLCHTAVVSAAVAEQLANQPAEQLANQPANQTGEQSAQQPAQKPAQPSAKHPAELLAKQAVARPSPDAGLQPVSPVIGNGVSDELLAELTASLRHREPGATSLRSRLIQLNGRSGALLALVIGSVLLLVAMLALTLLGLLL